MVNTSLFSDCCMIQFKQKQTTKTWFISLSLSFYWVSSLQLTDLFRYMTELVFLHRPIRIYCRIYWIFSQGSRWGGGEMGDWNDKYLKRCELNLDILRLEHNSFTKSPTTDMSPRNLLTEEWFIFLHASSFSLLSWEFKIKNRENSETLNIMGVFRHLDVIF